jgi:hypothetical protein
MEKNKNKSISKEKCKAKLVPKLVAKQIEFTRKFTDKLLKKHLAQLEKEYNKEPNADLEKQIQNIKKNIKTSKKNDPKANAMLTENFTNAYCNPGCKGTIFQEDDFDVEKYVKDNICKKKGKTCNKNMVKFFKQTRKNITKNKKRILDDDGFYFGFINKSKKAQLIKDGAVSGCALMSLV